jgi:hypothetical protein
MNWDAADCIASGAVILNSPPPSHGGVLSILLALQIWPSSHKTHCWLYYLATLSLHKNIPPPPTLRGFLLLIATWRSRMVCLSLSAGIPGLELPEHEGLILSPQHVQPLFGLFSSLLESRSMFSSSI